MSLVKTSVIACALSALLAGPVLAQGVSSDTKLRGSAQTRSPQGGMSGSDEQELSTRSGAADEKMGMQSSKGAKSTTGSTAHKGAVSGSPAPATKRQ